MRKLILIMTILVASSCREFYDEEFLEDEAAGVGSRSENVSYSATLNSTDPNLLDISGTAKVNIDNEVVNTSVTMSGLPQNIIQVHYAYIAANCQNLVVAIPTEIGTTRSYTLNETSSTTALSFDLRAQEAETAPGDTNLEGKSLVVRAFSTLGGLPTTDGTNVVTVACGELAISTTPPPTTTTGTTQGGVTGGDIGGTVEGAVGGSVSGSVGGTVDGAVGGATGGFTGGVQGGFAGSSQGGFDGSFQGGVQGGFTTGGTTGF
jgi:hypothetical protein